MDHPQPSHESQKQFPTYKRARCVLIAQYIFSFALLTIIFIAFGWFIIGWLATLVWALIKHGQDKHADSQACRERSNSGGGFKGLPDFYGLGIRIGLYMQWAASIIANTWVRSERRAIAGANVAFLLALYAAILAIIFQDGCVFTSELTTLMYILWGGFFIVVLPHVPFRIERGPQINDPELKLPNAEWRGSKFHGLEYLFGYLAMLFSPTTIWFWIRLAMAGEHDFASSPGGTEFFLFARLGQRHLRGTAIFTTVLMFWMWTPIPLILVFAFIHAKRGSYSQHLMMAALVFTPQGLAIFLYCLIFDKLLRLLPFLKPLSDAQLSTILMKLDPYNYGTFLFYKDNGKWFFGTACSLIFIYVILAIELTLKWNSISDVYEVASTGQIIPLTVGLVSLLALVWKTYGEHQDRVKAYVSHGRPWATWIKYYQAKADARHNANDSLHGSTPHTLRPKPGTPLSPLVQPLPSQHNLPEDTGKGPDETVDQITSFPDEVEPIGPMAELEPVPMSSGEPSIISEYDGPLTESERRLVSSLGRGSIRHSSQD